jgi:uncharacterized coiled-coil protein SlyX
MKMRILSLLIISSLICLAFLPKSQAVSPPPDGGYAGGNTAEGQSALLSLTTGIYNTAVGVFSLLSLTDGTFNTGIGAGTLLANTANQNTAVGAGALFSNGSGSENTANGAFALFSNTGGIANTANGNGALFNNTGGNDNTATGGAALFSNTAGNSNVAIGVNALFTNAAGNNNVAIGVSALQNTTGSSNIAVGFQAGTSVGSSGNVIAIGSPGDDVDNSCFIGNIRDVQTQNANAMPVLVDSAGQLGTISSSRRFKKQIKPMDSASEAVLALKPVTFHYKNDRSNTPQFGLIAEEVAQVNPDLVVRDDKGDIYSVRYDAVNAMLLNEFLKAHSKMREQEATIAELQSTVGKQEAIIAGQQAGMKAITARLNQHEAQIQKVSEQIEPNKLTPQAVVSGR